MKKYNWTIDDIENRLKIIKEIFNNAKSSKAIELAINDYNFLQSYIDEYYNYSSNDRLKLIENYKLEKNDLTEISFLWKDIKKFTTITSNGQENFFVPKTISLSNDDILTITHDFYNSLNKFFFKIFMKTFKWRKDHIRFSPLQDTDQYKGITIYLSSLQENFIDIKREYTIEDILTTIHEYSHANSSIVNPKHLIYPKYLFAEIDTLFMELIASDYIENLINNGNAHLIKVLKHQQFCWLASTINDKIKLIEYENYTKKEFSNNKELKEVALKICNILPIELEDMLNFPEFNSEAYITSYMFALEFYNLYKTDKEKCLYYLKKFILLEGNNEKEYYDSIKKLGFEPNFNLQEFHTNCKKDIITLSRKQ